MENLFIGNIMHRTKERNMDYFGVSVQSKGVSLSLVKLRAVLHQTEDGRFIDIDELDKKEILQSIPKSSLEGLGENGYFGFFVDTESIMPYNEKEHKDVNSIDGRTSRLR